MNASRNYFYSPDCTPMLVPVRGDEDRAVLRILKAVKDATSRRLNDAQGAALERAVREELRRTWAKAQIDASSDIDE